MRAILETCVRLDRNAYEIYRGLASVCAAKELTKVFADLALDEREHVDWWSDLLIAWETGLVPDIADEADILAKLTELEGDLEDSLPEGFDGMSTDQMLDLATRLEFYMLDPVFGELIDTMQPGGRSQHHKAYSTHVLRLIEAIESHYSSEGLSRFLARVLKRAYRDQQRLASLAVRDQLTDLYNRRGLLGHLKQWISWSARYRRPLAVALIDIDHFKGVNDAYGHAGGDEALRAIAGVLERAVRDSDVVGRFGGDEFLVLAPETDEAELALLMERLASEVRDTPVAFEGELFSLTVSVGGSWTPGALDPTLEQLIAAADRSLYAAKEAGRDRVGDPIPASLPALA